MREVMIMKKLLTFSGLNFVLLSAAMVGTASAQTPVQPQAQSQAVGKVISSTPVLKRVTEPRNRDCARAVDPERCRADVVTEDRVIGYKVVYEYAGKQHEVQLPFPVGQTIPLEVSVTAAAPSIAVTPTITPSAAPVPVYERYESRAPVYTERYTERVYVDDVYYPRTVYSYPAYSYPYYYSPVWPILGISLALGAHYRGGYYYGHGGHYRGGLSRGYRHGPGIARHR
jgi:hypothetical protein